MLRNFGFTELLLVLLVILLLFGAKRLPELARSLGKSLNEFKKGREQGTDDEDNDGGNKDKPDQQKKNEKK